MHLGQLAWAAPVAAAVVFSVPVVAEEIVVQNDRLADGGTAAICPCFVSGEEAAVWLTSPCDGNIVAVQIFWSTQFGGAKPSLEDSIEILAAGDHPIPGPLLQNGFPPFQPAILEGPLLVNGGLNEFRYFDENNTVPLSIPVQTGETFVVSLRFFNANAGDLFAPSIASDANGCQPGKNAVFALPGGWTNACALGVSGDWVIRAVVDCAPGPPGACCLPSGDCDVLDSAACTNAGGAFQGSGSACGTCPDPVGACCVAGVGVCDEDLSEIVCAGGGGIWQGAGSVCGNCVFQGACCIPKTGNCAEVIETTCIAGGGVFIGLGSSCDAEVCFPTGGCCLPDVTCSDGVAPADCAGLGGTYEGNDSVCADITCPEPQGACCFINGNCSGLTEADCDLFAGAWSGAASTCEDADESGTADVCEGVACPADINDDGTVDVVDLVQVITNWNQTGNPADVNTDGIVDVLDLVEVITTWGRC